MNKPRILIVDDNHMLTDMWRMLFGQVDKFELGIENNGAAALETARIFRPDLIFLDVCMADRNGGEIALELDADPALKSTPIVFLTGMSREEAAECQVPGRYMVLTKPISVKDILACAERYFQEPALSAA